MYKIYCLVHPDTNMPFYVGATKVKLQDRLYNHLHTYDVINYQKPNLTEKRRDLIRILVENSNPPKIYLLFVTDIQNVRYMEKYCYDYIISKNVQLLQSPHGFKYNPQRNKRKKPTN